MNVHFIAIGGAIMHNLALEMAHLGHQVTGSDDEIFEPSRSRLAAANILPDELGWYPEKIHVGLDGVILGMHAHVDNPELARAQALGLKVWSFPEFIYEHSKDKTRIVVCGSHGKTTTTSMIMHALRYQQMSFDYLVGSQLEGFQRMVKLSDAPIMVIEGDEYLTSALDRRPKFMHYLPQVCIITGIAWDHANVFPTVDAYEGQFKQLVSSLLPDALLISYSGDNRLTDLVNAFSVARNIKSYSSISHTNEEGVLGLRESSGEVFPLQIFGNHNLENLNAAWLACQSLGMEFDDFAEALSSFKGAAKRLQLVSENEQLVVYSDFAHAPSKVKATVDAVRSKYPKHRLVACLELHTYSSLKANFLPQYAGSLDASDEALVYYEPHTFEIKRLPMLPKEQVMDAFGKEGLNIANDTNALRAFIESAKSQSEQVPTVLLMMSSGKFGGVDF